MAVVPALLALTIAAAGFNLKVSLPENKSAKNIIDQAYDIGVCTIGITGGECTCNKDFLNIAKYIRQKHISLIFLTNGLNLYDDENMFDTILSLYPQEIKISLYSMNPEIHDSMTAVKGSFHKTSTIIKKLREKNIPVTISSLQLKQNLGNYKDIIKFGDDIGAKVVISSFFVANPDNNNADLRVSGQELENVYLDKDSPESIYKNRVLSNSKKDNRTVCRAGEIVLSVSPMLNVTPCNDFDYTLGNLKQDTLYDIWNKIVPEFREKFIRKNLVDCYKYDYCKYCSYCPMRAFYENGFLRKSDICCEHAKAYYNALKKSPDLTLI